MPPTVGTGETRRLCRGVGQSALIALPVLSQGTCQVARNRRQGIAGRPFPSFREGIGGPGFRLQDGACTVFSHRFGSPRADVAGTLQRLGAGCWKRLQAAPLLSRGANRKGRLRSSLTNWHSHCIGRTEPTATAAAGQPGRSMAIASRAHRCVRQRGPATPRNEQAKAPGTEKVPGVFFCPRKRDWLGPGATYELQRR